MPRGKGRKVLPYRNAAAGRRPPPVAPRQVERHNLRRRRLWAQLEQAEDHGAPVQVQQPNDNDPNLPISLLLLRTPNLPISLLLPRTPNLPISLLLLRNITMKMLLHHIYFLHPKLCNRCHRLKMVRL